MPDSVVSSIPERIARGTLDPEIAAFLRANKLALGGKEPFTDERRHHTEVLAVEPPQHLAHVRVEPLIVSGPVGDFNVRCYHPSEKVSSVAKSAKERGAALVYIHGGGWTVGTLPEFDSFFRIMAEEGGVQIYALEYHLAPEFKVVPFMSSIVQV
jgi:acetyl esterase/lipase